jgi:hypothetical protein
MADALSVLGPVLEHARRLNVEALKSAFAACDRPFVEPAFLDEEGNVVFEGPYALPCRADGFAGEGDEPGEQIRVDPATRLDFTPIRGRIGAADFVVQPFGWDYANVSARLADDVDLGPLCAWFLRWFDAADDNLADDDGLFRVVHFLSDPEFTGGRVRFDVDFGSAPVDAFADLLETLARLGAQEIRVS